MINYRSLNKLYSVTVLAGKLIFDLGEVGETHKICASFVVALVDYGTPKLDKTDTEKLQVINKTEKHNKMNRTCTAYACDFSDTEQTMA